MADNKPMEIETSRDGGVLAIGFNRPQKKNAFTSDMYVALEAALREGERDDTVRAILFHGQPGVFTAGNDLEDFMKRPPQGMDSPVFRFLEAAKPLVAAVNGPAVGIGTTLLLHCDLVYAGDDARFRLPFASLGLVPEFASSYLLPMVAGYQRAAELLLLGEPFDAQAAYAAGFVTKVVPAAQALDAAREAARKVAALPVKSVRLTKALLKGAHRDAVRNQLQVEAGHFRAMLGEPAAREALSAFLEKRAPDFSKIS
ncbi:MAG TPA: enoyl-CoA hydratase [Usitatibacter sp.]